VGAAGEGLPGVSGIAIVGEWILATLPADSTLAMIRRDAPRDVAARLTIADSPSVDGCTGLAGLDASGEAMGARFPRGVVVVQDDDNAGSPPNFKLVPWEACLREATRRP
jgi:3-phytase